MPYLQGNRRCKIAANSCIFTKIINFKYVSVPEGLLSIVEQHVPLEVVLETEAKPARLTHEGLQSRVDHPVLQEPHLTLEGLVALAALEWPLFRV